jgi:hypothetical protein
MVGAGLAAGRHDLAGERSETPLHAVAHDRAADLLGHGKADAHRRIGVRAVADEQHEPRGGCSLAGVGGDEVGALREGD